ncbi:MAG: preprotein translocase subunit YajC [Acidobacteria bacterium]|nr:preprotein translocase subunit YajC [Acidobacteriota bacterium]
MTPVLIAAEAARQTSPLASLLPILVLVALFWFVLIRPQRRMRQQQMNLVRSIELGDEVETVGGIFGMVRRLEPDVIWLEVAAGTTIKVTRGAVRRKIVEASSGGDSGS